MRIVKMHPDKKRTLWLLTDPSHGMLHHHHRSAFHTVISVFAALATVKPCIICVKASLEARHRGTPRVEDLRADKRCRAISAFVQNVRKIWNIFRQRSS